MQSSMRAVQSTLRPLLQPVPLLTATAFGVGFTSTVFLQSKQHSMSMSTAASQSKAWKTTVYEPRHASWPYQESDFVREDPTPDSDFYSSPRFVTHIDDAAISTLRDYYDSVLPRKGRILDLCSSWVSHYPQGIEEAAANGKLKVTGMGMSVPELKANKVLNNGRVVVDLNEKPDVGKALSDAGVAGAGEEEVDVSTMVVSIDYLTHPVDVLQSLRDVTKTKGVVHLVVSNRCFPTKAIARWGRVSEHERLLMVGDFLHFAGWKNIEVVELSDGKVEPSGTPNSGSLGGLMAFLGMNSRDPLWVVRGSKER